MKKVLIIGGNGFIGRNIAYYLLEKGYYVGVYDIKELNDNRVIKYYCGNAYEENELCKIIKEYDIIINALSIINPSNHIEKCCLSYEKDIKLNIKIMDVIKDSASKYIFISSGGAIYGDTPCEVLSESTLCRPINFYGSLKLAIEGLCHVYNHLSHSVDFISLRIANAFGPFQNYNSGVGFIDAAIKCALSGETLYVFGDGTIIRDYIYISDICYLIERIIDSSVYHEIYNISTGVGTSQNDIINHIRNKGFDLKTCNVDRRLGDIKKSVINNDLIKSEFSYKPMPISVAIDKYIEYLERQ